MATAASPSTASGGILLLVVGGLALASCGGGESAITSQPEAAPTSSLTTTTVAEATTTVPASTTTLAPSEGAGCANLHAPGEHEGVATFEGVDQAYWIVVPDAYADVAPAPLYVNLPSGSGNHDAGMEGSRPYLDDVNGLMVIVNTANPQTVTPDALLSLIDQLSSDYCVNPKQVHVMGTAWTGPIAENLACAASDTIASFISFPNEANGSDCTPARPVPLLAFTGDTDRLTTNELVDRWSVINGCDPEPAVEDLGSGVQRKTFQNCEANILFYDIEGMGQCFVFHEAKGPISSWVCEYEEFDYFEDGIKFFADHPLP